MLPPNIVSREVGDIGVSRVGNPDVAPIVILGEGWGKPFEKGAMSSKRRTETTIETHQVWIIRRPESRKPAWCFDCTDQAAMLSPEEAMRMFGVSLRAIYRSVEAGRIHFSETPDGRLFVCLASLSVAVGCSNRQIQRETIP